MLKGQAKKEYQKIYMRNRRKKQVVRPSELDPVQPKPVLYTPSAEDIMELTKYPELDADGNPMPEYD